MNAGNLEIDGWTKVSLAMVSTYASASINPEKFSEEYFDLYSVPNFQLRKPEFTQGKLIGSSKNLVAPGDVLICKINPHINRVWIVSEGKNVRQIASSEWIVVRPSGLNSAFLRYYFCSRRFREMLCKDLTGVGGSLTRAQPARVLMYPVPLAPLNEQKRIADKLDSLLAKVDACRERLDRIPQIIKRFRQSVLAAATSGKLTEEWRGDNNSSLQSFDFIDSACFGNYAFPSSWDTSRLGEIAEVVGGITKDSKKDNMPGEDIPYLRVANVQRGYLDLSEMKTIRVPTSRVIDLLLLKGDILFNEGGDLDKLGRGWIWDGEIEKCTFQNHVFRARLRNKEFSPKYFSWYGNSIGYDYFVTYGKQTTNLASINKRLVTQLPVALPPIAEQHEIVRRVEILFAYADKLEARYQSAKAKLDRLTPALLAKAFRGELVPQDPNDEPASVLLERIRTERAQASAPLSLEKREGIVQNRIEKAEGERAIGSRLGEVAPQALPGLVKIGESHRR